MDRTISRYEGGEMSQVCKNPLWIFSIGLLFLFSGCTSFVDVRVSRFHELPTPAHKLSAPTIKQEFIVRVPSEYVGKRFSLLTSADQSEDLERKQYGYVIARELILVGFEESKNADYLVDFKYATSSQIGQRVEPSMVPTTRVFCTGGSAVAPPRCAPFSTFQTMYQTVNYPFVKNSLDLWVVDAKTKTRVWQGSAQSSSDQISDLHQWMPYLVRALMVDFPGDTGKSSSVRFEMPSTKPLEK